VTPFYGREINYIVRQQLLNVNESSPTGKQGHFNQNLFQKIEKTTDDDNIKSPDYPDSISKFIFTEFSPKVNIIEHNSDHIEKDMNFYLNEFEKLFNLHYGPVGYDFDKNQLFTDLQIH